MTNEAYIAMNTFNLRSLWNCGITDVGVKALTSEMSECGWERLTELW